MRTLVDRYEIGEKLGGGGTANVHRSLDTRLNREVAVKLFRADVDAELRRVESELKILASLNHQNLVTLYDAGADPEAFLVMELVEGPTLAEEIGRGPLAWPRAVKVGADLAAGLAHAHAHGVIHRDVKPANVLLGKGGAKLTDFGIAQLEHAAAMTKAGLTVGTAHYLSPEQVRGERGRPESDVYSLGLTLLEALTGERAFEGSGIEVIFQRLSSDPEIPAGLPARLRDILAEMTAADPEERPDAALVAARLREITAVSDLPTGAVDLGAAATRAIPSRSGRTRGAERPEVPTSTALRDRPAQRPAEVAAPAPASGNHRVRNALLAAFALVTLLLLAGVFHLYTGGEAPVRPDTADEAPVPPQIEGPLDELERLVQS